MTNAERQARFRQRRKAELEALRNGSNGEAPDTTLRNDGMTVTVSEEWRKGLAEAEQILGIPAGEYADFLMRLGQEAFNRKFQHGLTNEIAWWLIRMHSKYPDTFNVGSWEGSCNYLALDKLYEDRGVPVGKYQEWKDAGSPRKQIDREAELAALKALHKRAKRLGYRLKTVNGARSGYQLSNGSGGIGGSLEYLNKRLDRVEAGLPLVAQEEWSPVT